MRHRAAWVGACGFGFVVGQVGQWVGECRFAFVESQFDDIGRRSANGIIPCQGEPWTIAQNLSFAGLYGTLRSMGRRMWIRFCCGASGAVGRRVGEYRFAFVESQWDDIG